MNTTHTDELLARYLDGALSDAEHQEFEHLVQSNPDFAQDVRELHTVQNLLTTTGDYQAATVHKSLTFLSSLENNLAAIVAGAGAAAGVGTAVAVASKSVGSASAAVGAASTAGTVTTGVVSGAASGVSSLVASFTSSWVGIVAAGATALGGAGAVYYMANKTLTVKEVTPPAAVKNMPQPTQRTPNNEPTQVAQSEPQAGTAQAIPQTEQSQQAQEGSLAKRVEAANNSASGTENIAPGANNTSKPEYAARIAGGNSTGKYMAMISEYERQLRTKDAQGDKPSAALLAKSLGSLYRATGRLQDARTELQRALNDARLLGIREVEGEALGELALVDAAEGKKAQAITRLREAVQILGGLKTENATSSTARWQQELVRLEKQQSGLREKPTNKKIAAERESRPRFRAPN